jgi:hypothetical protein
MSERELQDATFRVVSHAESADLAYLEQKRERTDAQKLQDQLLDTASGSFTEALALVETGNEALRVLGVVPEHRNLPTLLTQQIEQVAEVRRVRQ